MAKSLDNEKVEEEWYKTTDFCLVAFLECAGFIPKKVERKGPKGSIFCFKKSEALEKATEDFWDKCARVEPQEFFEALKTIKTRLYAKQ